MGDTANYTSYQAAGNATVDLVWTLEKNLNRTSPFLVWKDNPDIESDHSLVSVDLLMESRYGDEELGSQDILESKEAKVKKIAWNNKRGDPQAWDDLTHQLATKLENWNNIFEEYEGSDIQLLWSDWWEKVSEAAGECLGEKIESQRKTAKQTDDSILKVLLLERNTARRKRNDRTGEARVKAHAEYTRARRAVKALLKDQQIRQFSDINENLRQLNRKDTRKYWSLLKECVDMDSSKRKLPREATWENKKVSGARRLQAWKQAFEKLGQPDTNRKIEISIKHECKEEYDEILDKEITIEEIKATMSNLAKNKAAGWCHNEMLLAGKQHMIKAIWILCRMAFKLEKVPNDWVKGLIIPIHKDGDKTVPDNYRGITLLSVVGKVYTAVLNARITEWSEKQKKLVEEQAGFRKGRSTTDHLFVLTEIIRSRKEKRKDTFCAFLDLKKAYDTIPRETIWQRLNQVGIKGKMLRVLKSLYNGVQSAVVVEEEITDWFQVNMGLRQGCMLSPILFILVIDELARQIKRSSKGTRLGNLRVNILMFADDIVLIAENPEDLQHLLDVAHTFSRRWGLRGTPRKAIQ